MRESCKTVYAAVHTHASRAQGRQLAACAQELHGRWRTADPEQLADVAADLWREGRLRAMPPARAAAAWVAREVYEPASRRMR